MTEVAWVVRFVDKAEASRATRMDLNEGTETGQVYTRADGFSLGTSERLVAVTESMLTDDAQVTASKRNTREVVVPLAVPGGSDDLAVKLNALVREVDRASNLLEFKPGDHTGEAVFFTVLQGDVEEVDLDPDDYPDEKGLQATLLCQPVAVGLPVTGSTSALSNAASTGQVYTLPAITGDVATPLNVELSGTSLPGEGATCLLSAHTNPSASARIFREAETGTLGSDTTSQVNNTAFTPTSGNNHVRTTFATTPGMADRVMFESLSAGFGSYKMLVRVRKTTAGDVFDVRRRLRTTGGSDFHGKTTRYGATTTIGPHWLDLGQVTFPPGGSLPPGMTSGVVGHLRVQAERISGAGSLDFDSVVLVPVDLPGAPDVRTALCWHQWGSSSLVLGLNAEADEVYTKDGAAVGATPVRRGGSLPLVHPGHDNHLVLMRHVGTVPGGAGEAVTPADSRTWTSNLSWSYRPRWTYLSAPA